MTSRFEDGTEDTQDALDAYMSAIIDDYLAECDASPVRYLAVVNNGKTYKVVVEGSVIWFPSQRMKGRPKK